MSQLEAIRQHLESGRSLTPREALDLYGCFRLAPRIGELREKGLNILTDTSGNGKKHYAKYTLVYKREPNGQMTLCV